jgi:limonene-1,2-epoxide hydrolase
MTPARMDRIEAGVRTVMAFIEALNRRDVTGMMALMSEECNFESASPTPDGRRYTGKAEIEAYFQRMLDQSQEVKVKIEEAFGFGYRCIMLWRLDWSDTEGNVGHMRGVDIYRVQDGLIREQLSYVKG